MASQGSLYEALQCVLNTFWMSSSYLTTFSRWQIRSIMILKVGRFKATPVNSSFNSEMSLHIAFTALIDLGKMFWTISQRVSQDIIGSMNCSHKSLCIVRVVMDDLPQKNLAVGITEGISNSGKGRSDLWFMLITNMRASKRAEIMPLFRSIHHVILPFFKVIKNNHDKGYATHSAPEFPHLILVESFIWKMEMGFPLITRVCSQPWPSVRTFHD